MIEPDGMTTIQVSNTGATSILHSVGEDELEPKEPTGQSRYFYLSGKEAYEFYTNQRGSALLGMGRQFLILELIA